MPDRPRVLIVGAGIGGLTLAAGLQHFGIVPTVAEIEGSSLGRGLALMLTSNVGVALRRIGLDRAVAREGDGSRRDRADRRVGRLHRPPRLSARERPLRTHLRHNPRWSDLGPLRGATNPGGVRHDRVCTRLVNGFARA